MSNSTRCAACRYLRRKCGEDCVLAPHFPSTQPQRFACVHRIFGASNVGRMLQQLPANQRSTAADAISSEAYWRVRDPVYGSVGIISMLQQEINMVQRELAETQAQITVCQTQLESPPSRPSEPLHFDAQLNDHQFGLDSINFSDFHQSPHFP